jgi:putative transposase
VPRPPTSPRAAPFRAAAAALIAAGPDRQRRCRWEDGFVESLNARLRDELLDGEIFHSLREAQVVIESGGRHYDQVRPHASLGYRAPAAEVVVPALAARMTGPPRSTSPTTPVMAPRPVMH